MTKFDHHKLIAIGFGIFAAIFAFTFLLLMLVSLGVFIGLGISFANESGDLNQARIGAVGGVFAVAFYLVLGLIFVLPTAMAGRKMWKLRTSARVWAIIGALIVVWIMPMGTALAIYALWFWFSANGKELYPRSAPADP